MAPSTGAVGAKSRAMPAPVKPMEMGDPFAAFLAARPQATLSPKSKSPKGPVDAESYSDMPNSPHSLVQKTPEQDPFASFMTLRPAKPEGPPMSPLEASLRNDVLKCKRQILELEIQAHVKSLDPTAPPGTGQKVKEIKSARRYIRHPDRTQEIWSGEASEASEADGWVDQPSAMSMTQQPISSIEASSMEHPTFHATWSPSAVQEVQVGVVQSMGKSVSLPSLATPSQSPAATVRKGAFGTTSLPPIDVATPHGYKSGPLSTKSEAGAEDPVVMHWWSKTRCWNIAHYDKNKGVRRQCATVPGGSVVLGDGRLPLFRGSHLLIMGYYFGFRVDKIDAKHFPLDSCKDMSMGFGVSRVPAYHRTCERPQYAYEIPGTVLLGYGHHLIDGGKWQKVSWDPRELVEGDIVGLLISPVGELVVFVNGTQVLRVPTSFAEDGKGRRHPPSGPRRTLFPIIDIPGRVTAVTLASTSQPPNVPLETRSKVKEEEIPRKPGAAATSQAHIAPSEEVQAEEVPTE